MFKIPTVFWKNMVYWQYSYPRTRYTHLPKWQFNIPLVYFSLFTLKVGGFETKNSGFSQNSHFFLLKHPTFTTIPGILYVRSILIYCQHTTFFYKTQGLQ